MFKKINEWGEIGKKMATRKNILWAFSCLMILLLGYVFVHASRWSYYCADDFSHANAVGVFGGNFLELFRASIAYMADTYKTWQGTYFSMFIQGFLSPINGAGEIQMAIVMIGNVILFMVAVILLIGEVCRFIGLDRHWRAFLSFLALFSILGFKAWVEIFYWFSGAVSYSIPLSVGMFALVLFLRDRNRLTYVLACMLTFLASGGSLEVAGTSCFVILMILFLKGCKNLQKKDFIFFGIAVLGALINTVAPGNYARRDVIDDTGLHLGAALIDSVNQAISSAEYLCYQTPFLVIAILCVMIGFYVGGGKWFCKELALKIVGMCVVLPVVTCFPVYLAYSSANGAGFPNRCEFVCVFVIAMAAMAVSVLLGVYLKETGHMKECKNLLGFLVLLCLIMPLLNDNYKYSNTVIYRMYGNVTVDGFKKYHDQVVDIYEGIEKSENEDVLVESLPAAVPDFFDISSAFTADPSYFANQAIARYYGKKSVALMPQE